MTTKEKIQKASEQAKIAGFEVVETWLGPGDYNELKPEIRTNERDQEVYGDLRVRKMVEDGVRAGASSCTEGAGVN